METNLAVIARMDAPELRAQIRQMIAGCPRMSDATSVRATEKWIKVYQAALSVANCDGHTAKCRMLGRVARAQGLR